MKSVKDWQKLKYIGKLSEHESSCAKSRRQKSIIGLRYDQQKFKKLIYTKNCTSTRKKVFSVRLLEFDAFFSFSLIFQNFALELLQIE